MNGKGNSVYHERAPLSAHPEPVEGREREPSRPTVWFDKLTTNGQRGVNWQGNSVYHEREVSWGKFPR